MDKIKKHKDKILIVLVVLSLSWAALSSFLFFSDYGRLHRGGLLPGKGTWHVPHSHGAPTQNDIDRLKPWVTFGFVNKVFNLPSEFLKAELHITDTKYPNLTVDAAAKGQNVDSMVFLASLKKTLSARIALSASTTIQ